jgi:hypothetical protein
MDGFEKATQEIHSAAKARIIPINELIDRLNKLVDEAEGDGFVLKLKVADRRIEHLDIIGFPIGDGFVLKLKVADQI